jgi:hypothetical protein
MAGFTDTYENTVLDLAYTTGDKLGFSANGATQLASSNGYVAPSITWGAASGGQKASTADCVVTADGGTLALVYCAVFASDGTTQKDDWVALPDSGRTLQSGDTYTIAAGDLIATLD